VKVAGHLGATSAGRECHLFPLPLHLFLDILGTYACQSELHRHGDHLSKLRACTLYHSSWRCRKDSALLSMEIERRLPSRRATGAPGLCIPKLVQDFHDAEPYDQVTATRLVCTAGACGASEILS
jgi:hypothetical protein